MTAPLPPKATGKLARLARSEADAQTLVNATLREISESLKALDNAPHGPGASAIKASILEARARLIGQQDRHREAAAVHAHVAQWVRQLRGVELADAKPAKLTLRRGEVTVQAIARIRSEISDLQGERRKIESAPPPLSDLKRRAREYVADLVAKGKPQLTATEDQFELIIPSGGGFAYKPNIMGLIAWIDPVALTRRLDAELDQLPNATEGLSAADKLDALTDLRQQIADLEFEEEAFIEAALANGDHIERRASVDPGAILFVVSKRGAAAAAA